MDFLSQAFMYLLASVVAVPIAKKIGLGSVLGYLMAGIIIGPVLGFVGSESEKVKHFAEFGVVMMLFIVGLELHPSTLWRMRNQLLGLGGLQVALSMIAITSLGIYLADLQWQTSLAIGMTLALSSTAIVLQTLNEKGWMKLQPGQSTFSVLLFQDIAVIPMISLLPLLAIQPASTISHGDGHHSNALESFPGWLQTLIILLVIIAIVVVGKYLMRYVFRFISESKLREIFTASALLLVISIALLMQKVGLSPALGTFIAGVVLSDSEYRHELESDIAPFKGLLLGLFFISVGADINFNLLFEKTQTIFSLAIGLILVKFTVLMGLAKVFKMKDKADWLFALSLSQAGEFAFVLFGFAASFNVIPNATIAVLNLVVTITMLLTPGLFLLYEHVISPLGKSPQSRKSDEIDEQGNVIVAGVGRFGQMVSRLLLSTGHKVILLDHDPSLVELLRKVGIKTYYGDATRPDLLETAGIDSCRLFVAAIDDREKQTELIKFVRKQNPRCKIIARAANRPHVYELVEAGADHVERELFESSLSAGKEALKYLGIHPFKAERLTNEFRGHDVNMMHSARALWEKEGSNKNYFEAVRNMQKELHNVMQTDRHEQHDRSDRGWTPPPKSDATL